MKTEPIIICLTPVKNEAWILHRFLECASTWADVIILADQHSEDDTVAIASKFPKVRLAKNPSITFNEPQRQRLLFEEARKIEGKKLLLALDADECLSANFRDSQEWKSLFQLSSGTCIAFNLINIAPDLKHYWEQPHFVRGFMDDGSTSFFPEKPIHTEKVPCSPESHIFHCRGIKLLHYQYTDWERMRSKHRWYQAWETLNFPEKNPLGIYRMYHHMFAIPKKNLLPLREEWFKPYADLGIDMFSIQKEGSYYWDKIVAGYLREHGTKRFSKIDIWHRTWEGFDDPRSVWEKLFHWYLRKSQPFCRLLPVRAIDKILRLIVR